MTAPDGIPKFKSGTNEACAPALFADSGPATPSMAPWPNLSGVLDIFFSRTYEAKEATIAPDPGNKPKKNPNIVPLPIGP